MYFLKNVPDVDHNKHVLKFVGLYLRSIESYRDSNTTIRILVLKSRYISIFIRLRNKQRLLWALSELHVRCYALLCARNPVGNLRAHKSLGYFLRMDLKPSAIEST
jgi:hypothetical protein